MQIICLVLKCPGGAIPKLGSAINLWLCAFQHHGEYNKSQIPYFKDLFFPVKATLLSQYTQSKEDETVGIDKFFGSYVNCVTVKNHHNLLGKIIF